ncbi:MAG TPA: hypothetical protein VGQ52_12900 [Gemmatimonadaceae bacterium]|nr:hypothetical protein [Gemmatimonadaceae bacterium]
MVWSLSRWRPRHLFLSWLTYWVGLAGLALGPAIPAILRATSADGQGSINASYGDKGLNVTVLADGATAWSGAASLTAIALWIVGPPLLLWLLWFVRRKPRDEQLTTADGLSAPNAKALAEGEADRLDIRQRQKDPASHA